MRHLKLMGLCLVAVFALGALVATAAQAEGQPEFGRCVKLAKSKGKYLNSNCTERSEKVKVKNGKEEVTLEEKGGYEWLGGTAVECYNTKGKTGNYTEAECKTEAGKTKKGVFTPDHKGEYEKTAGGNKFTGAGGAAVLEQTGRFCLNAENDRIRAPREDCVGDEEEEGHGYTGDLGLGAQIECTHESATGEAINSTEVAKISVLFTGCTYRGTPATSEGRHAGEIQVNPLKGKLGYINKAKHEVGVLLEPATPGGEFVTITAFNEEVEIHVGVGNATEGSVYEGLKTPGTPNGDDGVISPIEPVNKMTHEFKQKYTAEEALIPCPGTTCEPSAGGLMTVVRNVPSKFEGGPLEALESSLGGSRKREEECLTEEGGTPEECARSHNAWNAAAQQIENTNTLEGEAEIKA